MWPKVSRGITMNRRYPTTLTPSRRPGAIVSSFAAMISLRGVRQKPLIRRSDSELHALRGDWVLLGADMQRAMGQAERSSGAAVKYVSLVLRGGARACQVLIEAILFLDWRGEPRPRRSKSDVYPSLESGLGLGVRQSETRRDGRFCINMNLKSLENSPTISCET